MPEEFTDDPGEQSFAPPAEQSQSTISGLRDWAKANNLGSFDHYPSDDDFARDLVGELARSRQPDPRAVRAMHQAREYEQLHADPEFQEWHKGRQSKQQAPPAQPQSDVPKWELPEHDPEAERYVVFNPETGGYMVHPKHASFINPAVAEKYSAYRKAAESKLNDIVSKFPDLVNTYMTPKLKELEDRIYGKFNELAEYRDTATGVTSYLMSPQSGIFERDPQTGQPVQDPYTNEFALSDKGKLALYYANQARGMLGKGANEELNEAEKKRVQRYTVEMVERDMQYGDGFMQMFQQMQGGQPQQQQGPPQQAQAQATPAQRNESRKRNWLAEARQEAAASPGRGVPANRVANNGQMKRGLAEMCNDTLRGVG